MTAPTIQGMPIPAGWVALQLKHACIVRDCKHVTAKFVDDGFPVASIREVQSRYVDLTVAKRTTTSYYMQLIEGGRRPHTGDLLFSRNATVGEVAQVPSNSAPFAMGQDVCLLRPTPHRLDSAFAWYVLRSGLVQSQIALAMIGSTFKRVNVEQIRNLSIVLPPLQQQLEIADFLDSETTKIDALVAKQDQLITTLREDRIATITQLVTKGLDPNADLKDSGVGWLGKVPAHWTIEKGTWIGRPFGSEQVGEIDVAEVGDIPFLKVSSLNAETMDLYPPTWFVSKKFRHENDFLVFPKRGAAIFGNKVNIVGSSSVLDPNLMGWKLEKGNLLQFYGHVLKLIRLEEIADVSTVPQINTKHIAGLRLPRPPLAEQREIVKSIEDHCGEINALISKADKMITTLREYRSALITDAVTGKIDVRRTA